MVRVTTSAGLLLAALLAGTAAAQGDLSRFVGRIPQCGITCILQEVPLSACNTLTNSTCICSDENLRAATQDCILRTCESPLDGIETARVEAEACQRPHRDRRSVFLAPMVIEILAFLSIWLRLYSRWTTLHRFEADDWIMLVCMIIFIPFVTIGNYTGRLILGQDVWTLQPSNLVTGLKLFYVDESLYLVLLALTKISLLCFFLRVFPNSRFRWATMATMAFVGTATTMMVFMQIFQCIPVRYNWERLMGNFGPRRCLNVNTLAYTAAGLSILQDVIILLLPLPLLLRLNTSWRSKVGIMIMFGLGAFILVTSIIRLQFLVLFARSANPTWDNTDVVIWSGLEVSVSVLVTSLPPIRVLLARALPGAFSSISKLSGQSGKSGSGKKSLTGDASMQSRSGDAKPQDQPRRQQDRQQQQQMTPEEEEAEVEQQQQQQHDEELREWQREQHQQQLRQQRRQSRRRTPQYLPPIPLSKFNVNHIFGWNGSRSSRNYSPEELELGDRIQGEVHTEIGVAHGGQGNAVYGYDAFYQDSSVESGIHVHTRTTVDSWHDPEVRQGHGSRR